MYFHRVLNAYLCCKILSLYFVTVMKMNHLAGYTAHVCPTAGKTDTYKANTKLVVHIKGTQMGYVYETCLRLMNSYLG